MLYTLFIPGFTQKFWQDDVLKNSLLIQHLMGIPNVVGIHGTLYRAWWCDSRGGFQVQSPKSSNYLRVFKALKWLILDCFIPGK